MLSDATLVAIIAAGCVFVWRAWQTRHVAILLCLPMLGCGPSALSVATQQSNAMAHELSATYAQLKERSKADQIAAAKAVSGDRSDPLTQIKQLQAAEKAARRYDKAWAAYGAVRLILLRVVATIKLLRDNPALLDSKSIAELTENLLEARSALKAYAATAMDDASSLLDNPPPALEAP